MLFLHIDLLSVESYFPLIYSQPLFFFFCFGGFIWSLSPTLRTLKQLAQITLAGCAALVIYDNNVYHRLCWHAPVTIYPHSDGIYRITIYTGFPYTPSSPSDAAPAKTHPTHAQYYEWWGYRNLFVGLDGCLRVGEQKTFLFLSFFPISFLSFPSLHLICYFLSFFSLLSYFLSFCPRWGVKKGENGILLGKIKYIIPKPEKKKITIIMLFPSVPYI